MLRASSLPARGVQPRDGTTAPAQQQQLRPCIRRSSSTGAPPGSRLASHNQQLEAELQQHAGWPAWQAEQGAAAAAGTGGGSGYPEEEYCVLGLGQAMVDYAATTSEGFLEGLGVEKGARKLISVEERGAILGALDGSAYQISAGGSLSNTLMGLARLGAAGVARAGAREVRVAMAGLIGADPLGAYYAAQMREAGVEVLSPPAPGAHTGTVCVLTSADAQRTMLSYLGSPAEVAITPALEAAIARARLLVVEGYLWELPHAGRSIRAAVVAAQRAGAVVAMTAGDAGVVERHHEEIWEAIDAGIDLLFTNAGEAAALLAHEPRGAAAAARDEPAAEAGAGAGAGGGSAAQAAALALGPHCSLVVVTDGDRGSYISALGQLHVVPPVWTPEPPVDTCGAGDAYAAGLLFGLLQNFSVTAMGRAAARTAAAVVNAHGATLTEEAAAAVTDSLPTSSPASFFESLTMQYQP
eukprot:scaffold3.g6310.t1